MHMLLSLFADDPAPAKGAGGLFDNPMLPFLAIAVLFMIFMVVLPARQQKKQQQNLLASLKKNDKVMTSGGIIGVISNISDKEDEVTLRLDEGKMRVLKSVIARVLKTDETTNSDAAKKS